MRKYMNQKKRCDAHQAYRVTQKPPQTGRLILTPGDTVIDDQACDANDGCSGRCSRTQENVADYVPAATQPKIDPEGPAQHVGRRGITKNSSRTTNGAAEGHDWLGVNNPPRKSIGEADQQCVPRADAQQERHYQTGGGIPGNKSNARN